MPSLWGKWKGWVVDKAVSTNEKEVFTAEEIQCVVDLILILDELNKSYEDGKHNKELVM